MPSFPKPQKRLTDKIAQRRERESQATKFRAAVWKRDKGLCRFCGRKVFRTMLLLSNRGEVHHRHGRNVRPEDRYNVKMAVLLCAICHQNPAIVQHYRSHR